MKKIGLVGGTGPESTLLYYKELNGRIDALTGSAQMPEIAIESVNFRRAWELVSSGNYEGLTDYLAEKIETLTGEKEALQAQLEAQGKQIENLQTEKEKMEKEF